MALAAAGDPLRRRPLPNGEAWRVTWRFRNAPHRPIVNAMRNRLLIVLGLLVLFAAGFYVFALRPDKARLSLAAVTGEQPKISSPRPQVIPTVKIADAVGWAAGAKPVAALTVGVGGFSLSVVAGVVALVLPSGLGARELVLGLTLATLLTGSALVTVVALSRVLITVVDLASTGLVLAVIGVRTRTAPPAEHAAAVLTPSAPAEGSRP